MKSSKILIALVGVVAIIAGAYTYVQSNKEYIDGNVLNIEYLTVGSAKVGNVAPPWINNGLVYHLLFSPLLLANADFTEFKPELAESYTISDDGLVYTFVKRKNLKWSDGEELTIDDIKFCFDIALNSEGLDPTYMEAFSLIDTIDSKDGVITITLKEPFKGLLAALSQFVILPEHLLSKDAKNLTMSEFWENPVGSGMYKLTEKNADYNKLEINPHYAGKMPEIETILLHKKPNSRLDYVLATDVSDMVTYRSMRGYTEHDLPITYYKYFVFNIEGNDGFANPAMQDLDVRTAICVAIDNEKIVDSVYLNAADAFTIESRQPYDLQRAKQLLESSSYDLNRPLRLGYYAETTTFSYFLQAVVNNLEEAGFTIQLVKEASANDLIQKRNFDVMLKDMVVLEPKDWFLELASTHAYARVLGGKGELNKLIFDQRTASDAKSFREATSALSKAAGEKLFRYPIVNLKHSNYISSRVVLPKELEFGNPWYLIDLKFEDWEIKKQ